MDDILELLAPYISDRLGNVFEKSEEYQNAVAEESELIEKLILELNEEQAQRFDQYFSAANATASVREKLTYRQGMADLLKILIDLMKD